jgi:hypothetical protein
VVRNAVCSVLRYGFFGALLSAASCDSAVDPDQYTIEIVSGDLQRGAIGAELAEPLIVRVTYRGAPSRGTQVRWRVIEGGASVSEQVSRTDAEGLATVRASLPTEATQVLVLAQVANTTTTFRLQALLGYTLVGSGYGHSCALTGIGAAYCWGRNDKAQIGDATQTERTAPVRVKIGLQFSTIAVGWFHNCGLTAGGELFCWGDNSHGQLGIGDLLLRGTPTRVLGNLRFKSVAAGYLHTCAISVDGAAYCWGSNDTQRLGAPSVATPCASGSGNCALAPVRVETTVTFSQITAGETHTCAIATDLSAYCWGWNSVGELGTGAAAGTFAPTPQKVAGGLNFKLIRAHARHTCALGTDGAAFCWGRNGSGETGQAPLYNANVPLPISADRFTALSTGNSFTCGITTGKTALCWGDLTGQTARQVPYSPSTPIDLTEVSLGFGHACVTTTFEIWCWGDNLTHQLGGIAPAFSIAPVRVSPPNE